MILNRSRSRRFGRFRRRSAAGGPRATTPASSRGREYLPSSFAVRPRQSLHDAESSVVSTSSINRGLFVRAGPRASRSHTRPSVRPSARSRLFPRSRQSPRHLRRDDRLRRDRVRAVAVPLSPRIRVSRRPPRLVSSTPVSFRFSRLVSVARSYSSPIAARVTIVGEEKPKKER